MRLQKHEPWYGSIIISLRPFRTHAEIKCTVKDKPRGVSTSRISFIYSESKEINQNFISSHVRNSMSCHSRKCDYILIPTILLPGSVQLTETFNLNWVFFSDGIQDQRCGEKKLVDIRQLGAKVWLKNFVRSLILKLPPGLH